MNKLLKDAIADAKAVRETALANAKLALEEAFAPKLQSMLTTKIREEMEEEEPAVDAEETDEMARMQELAGISEEGEEEMPSDEEDMGDDDMGGEEDFSDEGGEEDFSDEGDEEDYSDEGGEEEMSSDDEDLEEILRELEDEESSESTDEESMMEGPGMGAAQDPDASEEENAFWQMMNSLEEGMSDSEAVQVLKAAKKDPKFMDKLKKAFNEGEGSEEEEMDVNEIIRSLREEEETADSEEEEVDLNELFASLNEEEGEEEEEKESKMEGKKKMKKMEEELNEAYSAVKFLRAKLSEVNLLNAKLLYVNKLFRNNLTETQKVKVIENFDRAKTVREAKLVYATLSESIKASKATTKTTTKKSVMEGFASKATKSTKSVLTEGNDQINRFKKLAGII